LGSSLGVSIVGSVLVSAALPQNDPYVLALIVMVAVAVFGLIAAILIPNTPPQNIEKAAVSKKSGSKGNLQKN
jgi:nucleoside permease NupC